MSHALRFPSCYQFCWFHYTYLLKVYQIWVFYVQWRILNCQHRRVESQYCNMSDEDSVRTHGYGEMLVMTQLTEDPVNISSYRTARCRCRRVAARARTWSANRRRHRPDVSGVTERMCGQVRFTVTSSVRFRTPVAAAVYMERSLLKHGTSQNMINITS